MVLNTEWAQVEVIDLINDGSGLAFGIIGGRSTGVVVKTILPGGVADRDGRLQSGDHILQIGDVNLRGLGSEQVASVLRQCGVHVRMVVARPIEPTSSEYRTFGSHAPIVPTKLLGDPDELDRHLIEHGYGETFATTTSTNNAANAQQHSAQDHRYIYSRSTSELDIHPLSGIVDVVKNPLPVGSPPSIPKIPNSNSSGIDLLPLDMALRGTPLPETEIFDVELRKDDFGLGITVAGYVCEKEELSGIFVKSISSGSAADVCKRIQVNDRIIQVGSISLQGFTNHQAVEVLRNTGLVVKLKLERYLRGPKYEQLQQAIRANQLKPPSPPSPSVSSLPKYSVVTDGYSSYTEIEYDGESHTTMASSVMNEHPNTEPIPEDVEIVISDTPSIHSLNSVCTSDRLIQKKWKQILAKDIEIIVAHLTKDSKGGLGISLEGTVDVEDGQEVRPHHYIRSILPDGPVGINGMLESGDELLEVNGMRLLGLNHLQVVQCLKTLPQYVTLVCARHSEHSAPYRIINTSQDRAAFATRSILGGSLQNLITLSESSRLIKAKSDSSLASSIATAGELSASRSKSRSLEPVTGLAAWSNQPHIIELQKGDRGGLGFSILDYQDPMNPNETVIVIRSLVPGGVAQTDGRLIPGDRLLAVNDIPLARASLDRAVQAIKNAPKGVVRIIVAKPLACHDTISQSSQMSSLSFQECVEDDVEDQTFLEDYQECLEEYQEGLEVVQICMDERSNQSRPVSSNLTSPTDVPSNQTQRSSEQSPSQNDPSVLTSSDSTMIDIENKYKQELNTCLRNSQKSTFIPLSDDDRDDYDTCLEDIDSSEKSGTVEKVSSLVISSSVADPVQESNLKGSDVLENEEFSKKDHISLASPSYELKSYDNANMANSFGTDEFFLVDYIDDDPSSEQFGDQCFDQPQPTDYEPVDVENYDYRTLKSPQSEQSLPPDNSPPPPPQPRRYVRCLSEYYNDYEECLEEYRMYANLQNQINKSNEEDNNNNEEHIDIEKIENCDFDDNASSTTITLTAEGGLRTLDSTEILLHEDLDNCRSEEVIDTYEKDEDRRVLSQRCNSAPDLLRSSRENQMSLDALEVRETRRLSAIPAAKTECDSCDVPSLPMTVTRNVVIEATTPTYTQQDFQNSSAIIMADSRWGPQRLVQVERPLNGASLGISIVGGKVDLSNSETVLGIFVKNVVQQSPAGLTGQLKTGDRILEVDGVDLKHANHEKAVETIRAAGNPVTFLVQSLVPWEGDDNVSNDISNDFSPKEIKRVPTPHVSAERSLTPELNDGVQNGTDESPRISIERDGSDSEPANYKSKYSDSDEDSSDEEDTRDQEGRMYTKKGEEVKKPKAETPRVSITVQIDRASAGNVKRTKEEIDADPEEEDAFGYTTNKVKKKYHNLGGTVLMVQLERSPQGSLGLSLAGHRDRNTMAVFVVGLNPNGAAHRLGTAGIHVGDEILEVNGIVLHGRCHLNASAIIKGLSGPIFKVIILRRKAALEDIAVRPITQFPVTLDEETIEEKYSNFRNVRTVVIKKGTQSLGIMIIEGKHAEVGQGIFISDIQEGSAAEKAGLDIGDMILAVNKDSLVNANYDTAANLLKKTEGLVNLVVCNPNKRSDSNVADGTVSVGSGKGASRPPSRPPSSAAMDRGSTGLRTSAPPSRPTTPINEPIADPATCPIIPGKETIIDINTENKALGLSFVGGKDTLIPKGIIVNEIYPNGALAKDGRVKAGDQILEIHNKKLSDVTYATASCAIRQLLPRIKLIVIRPEKVEYNTIEVDLTKKSGKGLGLAVMARKTDPGVFISDILPGSVADMDGRIMRGDAVISVNDDDLTSATAEQAATALKTASGRVNIKLQRFKLPAIR